MKVNENYKIENLTDYGFEKIDKKYEEKNEQYTISYFDYKYNIGHARRGQFYYILVGSNREISIYASEPDGSGTCVDAPNILIELIKKDIFII